MLRLLTCSLIVLVLSACGSSATEEPIVFDGQGTNTRLSYGESQYQYAWLSIPASDQPLPLAVVIHGGCWRSSIADNRFMDEFVAGLNASAIATLNIEYRTVTESGGGWPNTFLDVARLVDYLPDLLLQYPELDARRITLVGHSAGGHLAVWAAAREQIDPSSDLHKAVPFTEFRVIGLGAITDLSSYRLTSCGAAIGTGLMGGDPDQRPERYRAGSPIELLPVMAPVKLYQGADDTIVPAKQGESYRTQATALGSQVELVTITGADHFDLIDPDENIFPLLVEDIRSF